MGTRNKMCIECIKPCSIFFLWYLAIQTFFSKRKSVFFQVESTATTLIRKQKKNVRKLEGDWNDEEILAPIAAEETRPVLWDAGAPQNTARLLSPSFGVKMQKHQVENTAGGLQSEVD